MAMDNVEEDADTVYQGILGEIGLEYSLDNPVSKFIIKIQCLIIDVEWGSEEQTPSGASIGRV